MSIGVAGTEDFEQVMNQLESTRVDNGHTKKSVAGKLGVTVTYYDSLIKGKSLPSIPIFVEVLRYLDMDVMFFRHWARHGKDEEMSIGGK